VPSGENVSPPSGPGTPSVVALNVFFTWKLTGSSSVMAAAALPAANAIPVVSQVVKGRRAFDIGARSPV
jgi:hypothetical protein